MAYEKKEGQGSLFRKDKQGVESRPDYSGDALINGVEVWVAGWIKEGKNGKWLSLSFKPKEQRSQEAKKPVSAPSQDVFESDIPF